MNFSLRYSRALSLYSARVKKPKAVSPFFPMYGKSDSLTGPMPHE